MIQVCSRCGTQWNVREQRRYWCPRCRGTLLEPGMTAPPRPAASMSRPPVGAPAPAGKYWVPPAQQGPVATPAGRPQARPTRLPAGYRWIAVRPGSPPAPARRRRPLGPTPRYAYIPRWGLVDHIEPTGSSRQGIAGGAVPSRILDRLLLATIITLAITSCAHFLRYALMVYNRGALIPRFVASASNGLVLISVAVAFAVMVATAWFLTDWMIARRAETYRDLGFDDPRSPWEIRVLCLLPIANIVGIPLLLLELAQIENRWYRQYRNIMWWTVLWAATWLLALVTWVVRDSVTVQGIADNALFTAVDYAVAAVAAWRLRRVYEGFTAPEGHHRAVRWLAVESPQGPVPLDADRPDVPPTRDTNSGAAVEPVGTEPAALDRDRVVGAW
ncbi:DUF4328 domain-containing protein [Mycobacteroides abscessus]|nr:DUF4328 domain-containing protein [Mycobacteroides abscessus]ANO01446.1 DUF4328 domain-containing protein [Mycobacteroides abscessus]ANO16592.1 DUF4328 domain-containing protein [Mycobacteroides abscessus]ANO26734.1 DUF4328 domain-containing protein [Mycobacteroides abscessus]ARQ62791.1 DUF4328 domain-containing protein [Mycobacteroides abscessus subsp. massiliense]MBL3734811.1 DUF4328 domain-containing protein [Mycobacteroides abscessus subsp. massiliense]